MPVVLLVLDHISQKTLCFATHPLTKAALTHHGPCSTPQYGLLLVVLHLHVGGVPAVRGRRRLGACEYIVLIAFGDTPP